MRLAALCAGCLLALTIAACGGGSADTFSQDDVPGIVRPPTGSSWHVRARTSSSPADLRRALRSEGRATTIADALASARLTRAWEWEWASGHGSLAGASANVFEDGDGADEGFGPLQDISPNWITPLPTEDLGDEAVGGRTDAGAGYTWRRGNLVLAAFRFRGTGPAYDYVAAARAYARELDERAAAR